MMTKDKILTEAYSKAAAILPCGGALAFRRGVKFAWDADASPRVEFDRKAAYRSGVYLVCPGCEADARKCPALDAAALGIALHGFAFAVHEEMRRDDGDGFAAGVADAQDQGPRDLDTARRGDSASEDDWPVFEIVHLQKLEAETDAVAEDVAHGVEDAEAGSDRAEHQRECGCGVHAADSTAANRARQGAADPDKLSPLNTEEAK